MTEPQRIAASARSATANPVAFISLLRSWHVMGPFSCKRRAPSKGASQGTLEREASEIRRVIRTEVRIAEPCRPQAMIYVRSAACTISGLSNAHAGRGPGASDPIRNLLDEGEIVVGLRRAVDLGRVQRRGERLHLRGRRARGRWRRRANPR